MNLFVTVQMAKEFQTWFAERKTAAPAPCLSLPVAPQCNCPVFLIWQQAQALALKNWLHQEYDVHMPNNNLPSSQSRLLLMNSKVWQAEELPVLFGLWEDNVFYCCLHKALNMLLDWKRQATKALISPEKQQSFFLVKHCEGPTW